MKVDPKKLVVYIPDTRGVTISRFGFGNLKIGPNVFTYSRLPGSPERPALGTEAHYLITDREGFLRSDYSGPWLPKGTCPGSSPECEAICYAKRPVAEEGAVHEMWKLNSQTEDVPTSFPDGCTLVRLHVSGDFTSVAYIEGWIRLCEANPDVRVWGYTRSWRVPELLPGLERLRALPNVQLLASMDVSIPELPPDGWRRAWIDGDPRAGETLRVPAHDDGATFAAFQLLQTSDGVKSLICPEETKAVPNCESCGYCFKGQRNDVTFLKH
jgi:hypothetical protein